ncbi:transposable element Tcb1 transposase [Trichonephila clavipes]|nr:transposable element Tcb1 transposase [Trichonephila clavipes]
MVTGREEQVGVDTSNLSVRVFSAPAVVKMIGTRTCSMFEEYWCGQSEHVQKILDGPYLLVNSGMPSWLLTIRATLTLSTEDLVYSDKDRSPLVHIEATLNSANYISGVVRPVVLPFIRAQRNPTFQQENGRPHGADIVQTFLVTKNVRLLPWLARSPDLSPTENVCSMVAKRLGRHHMPVTKVDELCYRVKHVWAPVPVHAIQSLLDSMSRRLSADITARGGCSGY